MDALTQFSHLLTPVDPASLVNGIEEQLAGKTRTEQFRFLCEVLTLAGMQDEQVGLVGVMAWNFIVDNNLWQGHFHSMEDFQESICYEGAVKPILERATNTGKRKENYMATIHRNWGTPIQQVLPGYFPTNISAELLRQLARLTSFVEMELGKELLLGRVEARLKASMLEKKRGRIRSKKITVNDVVNTLIDYESRVNNNNDGKYYCNC